MSALQDEDPAPQAALPGQGTATAIPYRLRIGVTGHRTLPDDAALSTRICTVLQRALALVPSSAATPITLAVLSPLAEGADRLVAQVVLAQPEGLLEAVLPMPREAYLNDFASAASRQEFDALLARADRVVELPPTETRTEAYAQAGHYVVEQCDVLVALWDGQAAQGQGGTAEIVALARDHGTPVYWVNVSPPYAMSEWLGSGLDRTVFDQLDRYNRADLSAEMLSDALAVARNDLEEHAVAATLDPVLLAPFITWLLPFSVRADILASQAQRQFFRFSDATFVFACLAVLVSAAPKLLGPGFPPAAVHLPVSLRFAPLIECLLMIAVLLVAHFGHRKELHQRWIAYRFLAERCRSAFFVSLVTTPQSGAEREPEPVALHQPHDLWLQRAFDEVWLQRPRIAADLTEGQLRRFLARAWVGEQRLYQERKSRQHARAGSWLGRIGLLVFAMTLCISALDAFDLWRQNLFGGVGPTIALYLSIVFPALAGALAGIGALRDHPRNARRSKEMAHQLARLERRIERAPDLPTLRALVRQTEGLMVEESGDWFVTMQFRDIEVHT